MKPFTLFLLAPVIFYCTSCASNEIGQSKDVSQETIYQSYYLDYDARENTAEIRAQFRFAGENGTTLVLNEPSSFSFDGRPVPVDSNDVAGAFYFAKVPVEKIYDPHELLFTDLNKKRFVNQVQLVPFSLQEPLPASRTAPVPVVFEGPALQQGDYIELYSTDTDSSFSVNYNPADSGKIFIPVKELQRQQAKAFKVYAVLYREIPAGKYGKQGGDIKTVQTSRTVTVELTGNENL